MLTKVRKLAAAQQVRLEEFKKRGGSEEEFYARFEEAAIAYTLLQLYVMD